MPVFFPFVLFIILFYKYFDEYFLSGLVSGRSIQDFIHLVLLLISMVIILSIISKKVSKDLEESRSLYQGLFNNSTEGLYQTTPSGKIISANPTLIKMLEFNNLEELLKRDLTKGSYVNPIKREEFKSALAEKGTIKNFESEWFTKNGNIITVNEGAKAVKNNLGEIIRYDGFVQDITIKKQLEKEIIETKDELDDFFKNDISASFSVSANGKILNCNETFLQLFNIKDLEEAKSKLINDLFYYPEIIVSLLKLLLTNKKITNKEVDFISNKGVKISCLLNLVGVYNENNKLIKVRGYLVDITQLKNAQNNLKLNEERFKLAVKATNEVIWERDLIKKTFWRSKNFATIFGWDPEDFGYTDEDIKKRMHPDDLERVSNKIYAFFESDNNNWEDSYRLLKADGSYAWVYDRAYKLNDKMGNPIKVVGSMANHTEKYIQQQKLKESEENYRNIVDNALIGVFETDLNGQILFCNQYIKDQSGYDLENEIESINIKDLYVDRSRRDEMMDLIKKNGFVTNFEVEFITKNKKIVQCLLNAKFVNNKLSGMLLDVTQLKKNESELVKFSQIINQSPLSIIITNKQGIIEYCNPKISEISGFTPTELIGKNPRIFSSGENSITDYKQLWQTLLSGNDWYGEFYNKNKNGELFWERASISPVFNSERNITHFIAIKEDITKEKRILEELTYAKDKAEESDRLKSAFISNMSHEIRTPMNGILGFSELLKSPNLTIEKQEKYISVIEKSGTRMLNTLNDIMDISRIESKNVKIYSKKVNINKQINEIYTFFKIEADKKGLKFCINSKSTNNNIIFNSDEDKLYAIVQNLVKNAIKFTKYGGIEIDYFVENKTLNIVVSDTGIGIPLERQPFVFDRFVQADIEDKGVFEGSGLGLTIAKSYAEMLGGEILLQSIEGVGSTFTLKMPINEIVENINNIEVISSGFKNNKEIKNLNILVVDDEELVQLYLQEILFKNSNNILVASNGILALEIFKANPTIDLILLDIQMPLLNGYEVARKIREFNKSVKIIAQTAFVQKGDREKSLEAGCDDYIAKPINQEELINKINKLMLKG